MLLGAAVAIMAGICARRRPAGQGLALPGPRKVLAMRGQEETARIPVEGTYLNALVNAQQGPVVVIALHPWGPMGGSMYDPHPARVCQAMGQAGLSTVRLNFRSGIGSGEGSVADVKAAAAWFVEPQDGLEPIASQVLIVGYSYGSVIGAAAAAEIPQCIGYVTLGPPLDYAWALYIGNGASLRARAADSVGTPKLLLLGTADQFCSEATFQGFLAQLPEPKKAEILNGIDHFSMHQRAPLAIMEWIPEAFGVPDVQTFAREGARESIGAAQL